MRNTKTSAAGFLAYFTPLRLRLIVVTLLPFGSGVAGAQDVVTLPVYTSPIDVTDLKVQLLVSAPDRESGKPIDVPLPPGLPGPKLGQFFSTPLSAHFDKYWNQEQDPKTHMTPREAACEGADGIRQQVIKQSAGRGERAYGITCNLATTGQLVAKQIGSTMILAYLLKSNMVSFTETSPASCAQGHGSLFCPEDPSFTVHFATEIVVYLRTPSLCQIRADGGSVYVVGAWIEPLNLAADAARLFFGKKFVAGEEAMTNTVREQPVSLDDALGELRRSSACSGKAEGASRILNAFGDLVTEIDMRQGIILRMSHLGILAPTLDGSTPGTVWDAQIPGVPSFTRPTISTSQPLVIAGNAVQTSGQHFPPNTNLTTEWPVPIRHGGYGAKGMVLGGSCGGFSTELEWGPASGPLKLQQLQSACVESFNATKLTPSTVYQFRARDCDPITCSPWSVKLKVTTEKVDSAKGNVIITIDGSPPLVTANVDAKGAFGTLVLIPAGTSVGPHTIHAINGDANANAIIQVGAASTGGASKASIMMVAVLKGETGCPSHPINSTQTDDSFMLFGSGFSAGNVTIRLDNASGAILGTATVHADSSICQQMQSPPGSKVGAHMLVAVQSGAIVAQQPVTFVRPSGIH